LYKKLTCILLSILLIVTIVSGTGNEKNTKLNYNSEIFKDINQTTNKVLIKNEIIGNRQVKYWEHYIEDILVKNNSILLHTDIENDNILHYEKSWTNIEFEQLLNIDNKFEPDNYFWKKKVVFPNYKDCKHFYSFYNLQEFPVVCWEVRHTDGTTVMYNIEGEPIGYGIPTPFEQGFSISNDCGDNFGDCWRNWRQNADKWFKKWCESTVSIGLPTIENISSNIQDQNVTFFFELGHSHHLPTRFLVADDIYYNASLLQNDMGNRQPMKFAFIGSCEGMRETGDGTLSHEFRKGEINNTVTVGYIGMANCSGWSLSLEWQDYMFKKMDNGSTIKESFDSASAKYPTIADCVRFVGDEYLKVKNPPTKPKLEGTSNGYSGITYNYTFSSNDIDRDDLFYYVDFGDGNILEWIGPY